MTTIALSTSEMAPHRRRTARRARPRAPPTGVLHLATKKLYVAGTGLHQALFFFAQSALRALVVYACGLRWCLRALQIRLPLRLPLALAPGALEECEAEECAASPRKKAPARIKISVDMDDGRPGPPLPEAGETSPVSPPSSPEFGATGDPDMVNMCEFMLEDRVAQAEDEEVRALASDVDKALRSGGALDPIAEGVGGSYVVHTATGFPIAVFKPEAEEVGSAGWALENALDAKACVPARGTSVLTASVREGCAPGWGPPLPSSLLYLLLSCTPYPVQGFSDVWISARMKLGARARAGPKVYAARGRGAAGCTRPRCISYPPPDPSHAG